MQQRHHRPCHRIAQQPRRTGGVRYIFGTRGTHIIEIDDKLAAFEKRHRCTVQRLARNIDPRPLPARRQFHPAFFAGGQQQARRAIGNIGHRLHDPFAQGRRLRASAAHRIGETNPFGAVVIPVLEQMLGQHDTQPAAHFWRRQHRQRCHARQQQKSKLQHAAVITPDIVNALRDQHHHHQIDADHQQRERLESKAARRAEAQFAFLAQIAQRQQAHCNQQRQPAQFFQHHWQAVDQIGDGVEIEII